LTTKNETLASDLKDFTKSKNELIIMTNRYTTALDLLGEKEEQIEEFKNDVTDLKTMYKTQLSDLLEQIDRLKRGQK
jgi:hypothetical protein